MEENNRRTFLIGAGDGGALLWTATSIIQLQRLELVGTDSDRKKKRPNFGKIPALLHI